MKKLNKIFTYWRDDLFGSKAVPEPRVVDDAGVDIKTGKYVGDSGVRREKEKEYPYNIEFGDGRTKEEMDKMQDELMQSFKDKED